MDTQRRRLVGQVTSNKMQKTVVVRVESTQRHPLYGKVVHRASKYKAHAEMELTVGDTVEIVESRPISKDKRWVVERVVSRGTGVERVG